MTTGYTVGYVQSDVSSLRRSDRNWTKFCN